MEERVIEFKVRDAKTEKIIRRNGREGIISDRKDEL